jgi:hypothetical protein
MEKLFEAARSFLEKHFAGLPEWPWFRAAGLWAVIVAGIGVLLHALDFNLNDPNVKVPLIVLTFVGYFFIVSVILHERLLTERKLREAESAFRYDKRGTLYNGTEPNIAFRIVTLDNVLSQLGNQIGFEQMTKTLQSAGEEAARDFANHFEEIYNKNIHQNRRWRPFNELDFKEKIFEWLEYDSQTGWGILTGRPDNKKLVIKIMHLEKLYEGAGGQVIWPLSRWIW